jgi:hypothetical protein
MSSSQGGAPVREPGPRAGLPLDRAGAGPAGVRYAGQVARGLLRRYLEKRMGMSRAQVTQLIACYRASGRVRVTSYRRHPFASRYRRSDIELLAEVDEAHGTLSGPMPRPSTPHHTVR